MKTKQWTVRQINQHTFCGQGYCYVYLVDGRVLRITRARTRQGVVEGRVLERGWEVIPFASAIDFV